MKKQSMLWGKRAKPCTDAVLLTGDDKRKYIIHVYHHEQEGELY